MTTHWPLCRWTFWSPARPDIVIVGRKEVTIIELTIPHNSPESMLKARIRKSEKESYHQVLGDQEAKGLTSDLFTETGSLGHWLHTSRTALLFASQALTKKKANKLMDAAACRVISASQTIFRA